MCFFVASWATPLECCRNTTLAPPPGLSQQLAAPDSARADCSQLQPGFALCLAAPGYAWLCVWLSASPHSRGLRRYSLVSQVSPEPPFPIKPILQKTTPLGAAAALLCSLGPGATTVSSPGIGPGRLVSAATWFCSMSGCAWLRLAVPGCVCGCQPHPSLPKTSPIAPGLPSLARAALSY